MKISKIDLIQNTQNTKELFNLLSRLSDSEFFKLVSMPKEVEKICSHPETYRPLIIWLNQLDDTNRVRFSKPILVSLLRGCYNVRAKTVIRPASQGSVLVTRSDYNSIGYSADSFFISFSIDQLCDLVEAFSASKEETSDNVFKENVYQAALELAGQQSLYNAYNRKLAAERLIHLIEKINSLEIKAQFKRYILLPFLATLSAVLYGESNLEDEKKKYIAFLNDFSSSFFSYYNSWYGDKSLDEIMLLAHFSRKITGYELFILLPLLKALEEQPQKNIHKEVWNTFGLFPAKRILNSLENLEKAAAGFNPSSIEKVDLTVFLCDYSKEPLNIGEFLFRSIQQAVESEADDIVALSEDLALTASAHGATLSLLDQIDNTSAELSNRAIFIGVLANLLDCEETSPDHLMNRLDDEKRRELLDRIKKQAFMADPSNPFYEDLVQNLNHGSLYHLLEDGVLDLKTELSRYFDVRINDPRMRLIAGNRSSLKPLLEKDKVEMLESYFVRLSFLLTQYRSSKNRSLAFKALCKMFESLIEGISEHKEFPQLSDLNKAFCFSVAEAIYLEHYGLRENNHPEENELQNLATSTLSSCSSVDFSIIVKGIKERHPDMEMDLKPCLNFESNPTEKGVLFCPSEVDYLAELFVSPDKYPEFEKYVISLSKSISTCPVSGINKLLNKISRLVKTAEQKNLDLQCLFVLLSILFFDEDSSKEQEQIIWPEDLTDLMFAVNSNLREIQKLRALIALSGSSSEKLTELLHLHGDKIDLEFNNIKSLIPSNTWQRKGLLDYLIS